MTYDYILQAAAENPLQSLPSAPRKDRKKCSSTWVDACLQVVQGMKSLPHAQVPNRQDVKAAAVEHRKHIN